MSSPEIYARLDGIIKRFGGVTALKGVSVDIAKGSVHSFIGENGAGKSTLGKVLSGIYRPDEGTVVVRGEPKQFTSPHDALQEGIATIQQEIALVPGRTVLENVFLGIEDSTLGLVRNKDLLRKFEALVDRTGFRIAPQVIVKDLRIADQQKVEIMRAIARDASLIILDEPTAALTPDETANLMSVIADLKRDGVTIVFVSHYLDEVLAVSDTITILRNGDLVRTVPAATETKESLIQGMLGRDVGSTFPERQYPNVQGVAPILEVKNLTTTTGVHNASFVVRPGEIVGVAGLVGAGRTELLRGIFGVDLVKQGEVVVGGSTKRITGPKDAIAAGLALIPEDRKADGLLLQRSVRENVALGVLKLFTVLGLIKRKKESDHIHEQLLNLDVRPAIPEQEVGLLSGGNQQKALFAKWLAMDPRVLLVDEPTRGVDIGAKFAIYEILTDWVSKDRGMVVVSSEVEELLGLADRILVMREGEIVAEVSREDANQEVVMAAAFGTQGTLKEGLTT